MRPLCFNHSARADVKTNDFSKERVQEITLKLLDYCKKNNWAGYDPYDALNSKLLGHLPFLDFRFFRIGLTQLLKRCPINIRPLLLVPKTQNPKAIALFLMAFLKIEKLGLLEDKGLIPLMIQRLIELRSPQELITAHSVPSSSVSQPATMTTGKPSGFPARHNDDGQAPLPPILPPFAPVSYWCWGYSFPWQTRTVLVPKFAPNLVCTTFVANALLEIYKKSGDARFLDIAKSAAYYIVNQLYWTDDDGISSLCYPTPTSRSKTHNANFLGAALLCRVYKHTGEKRLLECALNLARYSASMQREDGSWDYGEHSTQRWIDNFHTGFNLCAINEISRYADTAEFKPYVQKGFAFYRRNFFREDGAPKYFHNRVYPIDIHSVAQSIIMLVVFKDFDETSIYTARSVFRWTMANMWNERGYFYYQALPLIKNRIAYMRWSQAWMLLALSNLLEQDGKQMALNK